MFNKIRQYIVKFENLDTGFIGTHFSEPVTHKQACTLLSKLTKYSWRRDFLEEVDPKYEPYKTKSNE